MEIKKTNIDLMRPYGLYEKAKFLRKRDGMEFYKRNKLLFHKAQCVACNSDKKTIEFYKCGFKHVRCSKCRTLFVSPRPEEKVLLEYYSDFEAPRFWTEVLLKTDSERKVLQYAPRAKKVVELCKGAIARKDPVFLDVGAGAGNFALAIKQEGYFKKVVALEVSKNCEDVCSNKGLDTFCGVLSDYKEKVDCLTMNDLIEHVYSPGKLLEDVRKVLNPGGILMIATPNCLGFDFMLFGKDTDNVTPPEHIQYFNPESIVILLKNTGFLVLDVSTPGMLDVEIVERKVKDGCRLKGNSYIDHLIRSNRSTKEDFQAFLQRNNMSSHMVVFARKGR